MRPLRSIYSTPSRSTFRLLALNQEAKAVGLKRGNPLFQVSQLIEQQHVTVIDVHHQLYHDISHRIMEEVRQTEMVLDFVQYSVDEFFGMMPDDDPTRLRRYLQRLKNLILDKTGIPVSCGATLNYQNSLPICSIQNTTTKYHG